MPTKCIPEVECRAETAFSWPLQNPNFFSQGNTSKVYRVIKGNFLKLYVSIPQISLKLQLGTQHYNYGTEFPKLTMLCPYSLPFCQCFKPTYTHTILS